MAWQTCRTKQKNVSPGRQAQYLQSPKQPGLLQRHAAFTATPQLLNLNRVERRVPDRADRAAIEWPVQCCFTKHRGFRYLAFGLASNLTPLACNSLPLCSTAMVTVSICMPL